LLLSGTRRSEDEIEKIVEEQDKESIGGLCAYFSGLKERKSNNHVVQLSQQIPEEWLCRK
jgi:hypothetical protein